MKRVKELLLLAVIVGALAMLLATSAAAGDKATLCHKPGTPDEVTIEVSLNALDAHLAHGDFQGTCAIVTVLTCPFDTTEIPVVGPDPVKYVIDFPALPEGYTGWDLVVWSSTGQDYLGYAAPSGSPPPSLDTFVPVSGEPIHPGLTLEGWVWDWYVAKANPEDADFGHMVECIGLFGP